LAKCVDVVELNYQNCGELKEESSRFKTLTRCVEVLELNYKICAKFKK